MCISAAIGDAEAKTSLLLTTNTSGNDKVPKDTFHLAYITYFTPGMGLLLPWNAFITAVDYFTYLYPDVSVDLVFAVVYMLICLFCLLVIVAYAHESDAFIRINIGLALFVVSLVIVPVMDVLYTKGRRGLYDGYYVTVGAVGLSGVADALVQGGVIGSAGELQERYMQAVVAGTAASGITLLLLLFTSLISASGIVFFC